MPETLDHRSLYRLPWSLTDNPIAWLEPTQACNLACDGCYRKNVKEHKSIDEVQSDLDVFARLRNFDGVSIAGGDPLVHPQLPEIVRRVTRMGRKAIINTNGLAMTPELLRELKREGLIGLTFHVDSKQGRPGWRDKTETETNALRQQYADMVFEVGGLACAFNSTVYEDTLHEVPDIADWAARNIDRVHTVVFINYRAATVAGFEYYVGGEKAPIRDLVYTREDEKRRVDISAREVAATLKARDPEFAPCAYLNGTHSPDSFKWLLAFRAGTTKRVHGYLGPRFMELSQASHHVVTGRYLSYAPPWTLSVGRSVLATAWPVDAGVRRTAVSYLRSLALQPWRALDKVHLQSVLIIQPIDLLEDGTANMCDGCPDMTVHEGKLVWSCRLEEPRSFGAFVTAVPEGGITPPCRPEPARPS